MAHKTLFGLSIILAAVRVVIAVVDCSALLSESVKFIPNLQPYVAQSYETGTTFSTPDASPAYNTPAPNLAAFCRFGANYNTSTTSRFRFEVWMPSPERWNGRFAFIGNGGDAGGVNYPDMGIPLSKYGFAVASTDGGHNGTTADGSFAMGNPESQIDFGYRAVHMSTEFSKEIVERYYGRAASYNYWIGCSSGGKQGMKSIQKYPEDFDGAIRAPAQWRPHLNGFTVHVNLLNANSTTPGAVLNFTVPNSPSTLSTNETQLRDMVTLADATDPRNIEAMDPDLRSFFARGGKLMQFHGWADQLIASRSSLAYYEKFRSFFNYTDLRDSYNVFMVPGMGHCGNGPGANAFGDPSQREISLGGTGQSLNFDAAHDMILPTIDWVEKGRTPRSIITTRWKNSNITHGPDFTRLLCPYPEEGIYKGGDNKNASSYICAIPN